MEENLNPLAVPHLLQHTLRSLCIHENSQWVYAVFWRILPRNYPPPKWDVQGGAYDRSRGNRRNWILVWEDGFCNFAASMAENDSSDCPGSSSSSAASVYGNNEFSHLKGLQPELFFKMSHEIYNYGEGLIGKVAADHSHKWIFKEPSDQEINFLSAWNNPGDSVMEDLSYVVLLRKKFSYLESIPGVLLPHPSSSAFPFKVDGCAAAPADACWPFHSTLASPVMTTTTTTTEFYNQFGQPVKITPSMSSLEALLSKLPSVVPTSSPSSSTYCESPTQYLSSQRPLELMGTEKVAKQEIEDEYGYKKEMGESSSSMTFQHQGYHYYDPHHHHHLNVTNSRPNKDF
ncbi:PREDICTED: uncharacterized protein LOC104607915 isoform X2 [Nelumbo nucifera]|uniref:Uncharacterized protein LOC104607915 isoform X2 n=1 Tax=Nelumbo nucifera TaxID=4432 RepID=A0A1U8AVH7_NELNU|nr:PREDICTED: uncharacterized protein LOC104607915 isoform X2 [Nelumbo nucifera]